MVVSVIFFTFVRNLITMIKEEVICRSKVTPKEHTRAYLEILNGKMRLTDKELEVLAHFVDEYTRISADGLKEPYLSKLTFQTSQRQKLCKVLNMSSSSLSNYIKTLTAKQVLLLVDGEVRLPEMFVPVKTLKFQFDVSTG